MRSLLLFRILLASTPGNWKSTGQDQGHQQRGFREQESIIVLLNLCQDQGQFAKIGSATAGHGNARSGAETGIKRLF